MKIPDDHVMCELCREVIPEKDSKQYVASYTWGSFSGTPNYGVCCKTHPTDKSGHPTGQYARPYA